MDADLERTVRQLQDRQAIYDCLVRYCKGIDRLDRELLASAYHPDAIDDHGDYVGPVAGFIDYVLALHSKYQQRTQHMIINHACEIDGDTAYSDCYYIFRSLNREAPFHSIASGRYIDYLEKREGRWGIVKRVCLVDIRDDQWDPTGDVSTSVFQTTTRDKADPSYQRPLVIDPARYTQ